MVTIKNIVFVVKLMAIQIYRLIKRKLNKKILSSIDVELLYWEWLCEHGDEVGNAAIDSCSREQLKLGFELAAATGPSLLPKKAEEKRKKFLLKGAAAISVPMESSGACLDSIILLKDNFAEIWQVFGDTPKEAMEACMKHELQHIHQFELLREIGYDPICVTLTEMQHWYPMRPSEQDAFRAQLGQHQNDWSFMLEIFHVMGETSPVR